MRCKECEIKLKNKQKNEMSEKTTTQMATMTLTMSMNSQKKMRKKNENGGKYIQCTHTDKHMCKTNSRKKEKIKEAEAEGACHVPESQGKHSATGNYHKQQMQQPLIHTYIRLCVSVWQPKKE